MKTENILSVCVVDDDDLFLKSLKHYLQDKWRDKIKIRLFHSGEEFLKYIPTHKTDIVILDYVLNSLYPFAMDGRSVLQKIMQTSPEVKVIMLSGQDKIEVALDSIKNGAFDYVTKNDLAFLKVQNSIKSAIESSANLKRVQAVKRYLLATVIFAVAISLVMILFRMFFP